MCMINNKVDFDMDMAVDALMAIIEREPKAKKIEAQPVGQMITYSGVQRRECPQAQIQSGWGIHLHRG